MFSFVMPLRAIMLQGLLLLLAIAIESFVFQGRWKLSRKNSVDYSMAINLFSTVVGWALFFIVQPVLPIDLKQQIVNYVFFNYFKNLSTSPNSLFYSELIVIIFVAFILNFIIELQGLNFLQNKIGKKVIQDTYERRRPDFRYPMTNPLYQVYSEYANDRSIPTTLLTANALSGTLTLLVLLLINSVFR
jgi:hypothetical protein